MGRFESSYFQPQAWKPDYPNPAFDKMTPQDALWATRTVMRFSDEAVRAIVQTGKIDNPEAEDYLVDTLIERRNKIVRYYLTQINPLDGFTLSAAADGESSLEFVNLGVEAGFGSQCRYQYAWHRFDNQTETLSALGVPGETSQTTLSVPEDTAEFLMVRVSSSCPAQPLWRRNPVEVYLRNSANASVVGIERADLSR